MNIKNSLWILIVVVFFSATIMSCGDNGDGIIDENGSTESTRQEIKSVVGETLIIPGGDADCPAGGIHIRAGIDEDENDVLDEIEVDYSEKVCNGTDGFNSLVSITTEPDGENCSNAGQKIESGIDSNENGILDESEVDSTAYVCNGGDNNYIVKSREGGVATNSVCMGSTYYSNKRYSDYYTIESGGNGDPYKSCIDESCATYIKNGTRQYSKSYGDDDCVNSIYDSIYCDSGYTSVDGSCVPEPAECSSSYLYECTIPADCESNGGYWWDGSCHSDCATGEIKTSRGCELLTSSCTQYQDIQDNECVDITFSNISGNICGTYTSPQAVMSGDHLVTCDTTFNEKVIVEAGANFLVDNNWFIKFRHIYAEGTDANHITFTKSAGNIPNYWELLEISGGSVFYNYSSGYISGNYMKYVDIDGLYTDDYDREVVLNNVYAESLTIVNDVEVNAKNFYIVHSNFDVNDIDGAGYDYEAFNEISFFLNNNVRSDVSSYSSLTDTFVAWSNINGDIYLNKSAFMFNNLTGDISCYGSSDYVYGNKYSAGTIDVDCSQSDNSTITLSDKKAVYVTNDETSTVNLNEHKTFSAYLLDQYNWVTDATINWKATYDVNGSYYNYPSTWTGYNPLISFDAKESYKLTIDSVDGDTNIMGKKSVDVNVQ